MTRAAIIQSAFLAGLVILSGGAFGQGDFSEEQRKLLPIALKCPMREGTLELLLANQIGNLHRIRVSYDKDRKPTVVIVDISTRGNDFSPMIKRNLRTGTGSDSLSELAELHAKKANDLLVRTCLGTEQSRSEYAATLKTNRAKLGLPQISNVIE